MQNDIQNVIDKIKVVTLLHQPFFGTGASKLEWSVDNDLTQTACTNGKFIKFNSDYLMSLDQPKRIGLTVHEVMHVYGKHHLRRGNRDPELWNIATDFQINLCIQDAINAEKHRRGGVSCMELPEGALLDDKYRGMSAEDIYSTLEQQPPHVNHRKTGSCDGDGDGPTCGGGSGDKPTAGNKAGTTSDIGQSWGDVIDSPAGSAAEIADEEQEIEVMVEQAHNLAKSRGKSFGAAEALVNSYKKPTVDWRSVIRAMMQSISKVDYTYQRPHKYGHHIMSSVGAFIPDYHRENVGEIVLAIDTSASVTWDEVQQYLGECQSIMEELQPAKVHIVQCDARVQHVDTFDMGQPLSIDKVHGRGGTNFQPVFDWVDNEMDTKPMALVYLTDGYAPAPSVPDYPVYWAVTSEEQGHLFGEVVSVNISQ